MLAFIQPTTVDKEPLFGDLSRELKQSTDSDDCQAISIRNLN